MKHTKEKFLLLAVIAASVTAGCSRLPPMKIQDTRYGDSPAYWTKDPYRSSKGPRELTKEELEGKR